MIMMTRGSRAVVLLGLQLVQVTRTTAFGPHDGTRICGNFCGPGWCDNDYIDEINCPDSMAPESNSITGTSCGDACCKIHDTCCGHGSRPTCNKAIVSCLGQCNPASVSCTFFGAPVPAGGIWLAMDFITSWCCGAPCPADVTAGEELLLSLQDRPAKNRLWGLTVPELKLVSAAKAHKFSPRWLHESASTAEAASLMIQNLATTFPADFGHNQTTNASSTTNAQAPTRSPPAA